MPEYEKLLLDAHPATTAQEGGAGATRARRSTSSRTNRSGSGQGNPGSAICRLTVPCIATQTAVLSATTSVLVETPAATQASTASTSSAKL